MTKKAMETLTLYLRGVLHLWEARLTKNKSNNIKFGLLASAV